MFPGVDCHLKYGTHQIRDHREVSLYQGNMASDIAEPGRGICSFWTQHKIDHPPCRKIAPIIIRMPPETRTGGSDSRSLRQKDASVAQHLKSKVHTKPDATSTETGPKAGGAPLEATADHTQQLWGAPKREIEPDEIPLAKARCTPRDLSRGVRTRRVTPDGLSGG